MVRAQEEAVARALMQEIARAGDKPRGLRSRLLRRDRQILLETSEWTTTSLLPYY